jgi:hypothetical protein
MSIDTDIEFKDYTREEIELMPNVRIISSPILSYVSAKNGTPYIETLATEQISVHSLRHFLDSNKDKKVFIYEQEDGRLTWGKADTTINPHTFKPHTQIVIRAKVTEKYEGPINPPPMPTVGVNLEKEKNYRRRYLLITT